MEPRVRRLYLICVGTSVALVLVGWLVSIRSVISSDITHMREGAAALFEKAGEGFSEIGGEAREYTTDFSESLQTAKESYEESKAQQ